MISLAPQHPTTYYPSQQYAEPQRQHDKHDEPAFEFPDDYDCGFEYLQATLLTSLPPDPMQSDAWGAVAQFTPKPGRFSHQRTSSLSSLGSAGPASPFTQHVSNPHIAINDSTADGFVDMHAGSPYYQLAKPMAPYSSYQNVDNAAITEMAYPLAIPGPSHKPRTGRTLLPAPEFASGSSRSHPASVASSIAGDSPATPTVGELDPGDRRRQGHGNAPKLGRTMTDVYGDELYSPNFTITSSSPPPQAHIVASPNNDIFSQRINAANSQHLSTTRQSPASAASRDMSPFRNGSPLAPSPIQDWDTCQGNIAFNSAQRMREQNKARQDAQLLQRQRGKTESATPQTISPKDAMLEFNDPEDETNFPLFPHSSANFGMDQFGRAMVGASADGSGASNFGQGDNGGSLGGQLSSLQPQLPAGIQLPQRYPFISQSRTSHGNSTPRLGSTDSSTAESGSHTPAVHARPLGTGADGGTYTCTYHGCTLRFETPTLLQKHKREGHRQSHSLVGGGGGGGGGRPHQDAGMTPSLLNSQAGPHRCDRINPSTGKPCNTVFSRPYDLTRHEDTIHNARKQKVHCNLCTEEKTFSRADALTRHYRVCHPDVELPGKHRRRGGA